MKKYILLLSLLSLSIAELKSQVGINTSTPHPSSALDITSSNKGVIFPQYDLTVLNSTTNPVLNPADGLIIFNKGGLSTFKKVFYVWIKDSWRSAVVLGTEPQIMVLNIFAQNLIPTGSTNNTVNKFVIGTNKISGASLNADKATINLPAGVYLIRYSYDGGISGGNDAANTKYFDSNFICTRSYLINAANNSVLTEQNRMCQLSGIWHFFQGTFYLTLTAPTSIRQKFEFDTGNGLTTSNSDIRTSYSMVITRMGQ